MRCYRLPDRNSWSEITKRPTVSAEDLAETVESIFQEVERRGDEALREYTARFDGVDVAELRVSGQDIEASASRVPDELKSAIRRARENIATFHHSQVVEERIVETMPGVECWRRPVAIETVGLYVPGGSAPLVSTVLMLGIPAVIAGCSRIVLVTPPDTTGHVDDSILYACHLLGINDVYRVGGAQAIAALTFGTPTIPRVDKIFGPGNQYVTAAKRLAQVKGVAIDMPAGPSEVAIIADDSCDALYVACDMLAQAEHGPDSHILLVTTSEAYTEVVLSTLERELERLPRRDIARSSLANSSAVVVASTREAVALTNEYGPEHLIIATRDADELVAQVRVAGSVFVGSMSPEAAGDYATGTNHTLPTNGYARAYSGVSVDSFVKKITFQRLSAEGLRNVGPVAAVLAEAEGLDGHKKSINVRLKEVITGGIH